MKKTLLISALLITTICYSQKYYEIDLSKKSLNEQTIDLDYSGIKLINALPSGEYKIKIKVEKELENMGDGKTSSILTDSCLNAHKNIKDLFNKINNDPNESELVKTLSSLKSAIEEMAKGKCKDEFKKKMESELVKTIRTENFLFGLEKNQNIFIQIDRMDAEGASEKTWNIVLQTPREANYISHFGFTFSPNLIKTGDLYFSKSSGNNINGTDSFTIKKLNSNGNEFWKDLSLTANFLIPSKKIIGTGKRFDCKFAWMAGFGVGGDARFTVFTGPSILLNDFVALGLVGGVNYSHKLRGEYEANQGLSEALSFDQLHNRGIRPDVMISLSFRLSKEQLQKNMENIGEEKEK